MDSIEDILACYATGVTVLGKELRKLIIREINVSQEGTQVARLFFGFVLFSSNGAQGRSRIWLGFPESESMKLFSLTIWMLVGTGIIAAQTNDPQHANLPPAAPVQRTGVSSAPAGNPNPSAQTAAPTATPAPVPARPVDVPSVPPEVTFRDGMITLTAPNSSLASVLSAISSKTGIEFEGADFSAADRLALSIGPAPEADVLSAIFDGWRFNYVALGRPDSPAIAQRVILTAKGGSVPATPQPGAVQPHNADDHPDNAADNWETPGERTAQLREQLDKDREKELKLRELYLQQQKQQNPQPNP